MIEELHSALGASKEKFRQLSENSQEAIFALEGRVEATKRNRLLSTDSVTNFGIEMFHSSNWDRDEPNAGLAEGTGQMEEQLPERGLRTQLPNSSGMGQWDKLPNRADQRGKLVPHGPFKYTSGNSATHWRF